MTTSTSNASTRDTVRPREVDLFSRQERYLQDLRDAVRAHAVNGRLTEAGRAKVVTVMNAMYPGYKSAMPADDLIELNVDAVARELAGDD